MSQRTIELPVHGICVLIDAKPGSTSSITCDKGLYETCPHCGDKDCCYQCDESQQAEDAVASRHQFNGAVDCILAVVLAHAISGIDVEAAAYLEGIEVALNAYGEDL